MPHEPTVLERHAALAVTEAVDYLHRAQSLLDVAESAFVQERAPKGISFASCERNA